MFNSFAEMSSHTAITTSAAADTELTIETDMPTIENIVPAHVLLGLTKKERKRQDVIQGKLTSYFHYFKKSILTSSVAIGFGRHGMPPPTSNSDR